MISAIFDCPIFVVAQRAASSRGTDRTDCAGRCRPSSSCGWKAHCRAAPSHALLVGQWLRVRVSDKCGWVGHCFRNNFVCGKYHGGSLQQLAGSAQGHRCPKDRVLRDHDCRRDRSDRSRPACRRVSVPLLRRSVRMHSVCPRVTSLSGRYPLPPPAWQTDHLRYKPLPFLPTHAHARTYARPHSH